MNSSQTNAGLPCPVCKIDLVMSERQGIEIDYCPKCRGVWLDRGELDKIIERSLDVPPDRQRDDRPLGMFGGSHERSGHGDGGGHHGRRKGFLRDLFD
ncbi:zf-TFIIB domain-containing protein [Sphingomonas sp. YL-JM2C]